MKLSEYPNLHSIKSVKGLLIETCEGSGTSNDPCYTGLYFAQETESGDYKIYQIKEVWK